MDIGDFTPKMLMNINKQIDCMYVLTVFMPRIGHIELTGLNLMPWWVWHGGLRDCFASLVDTRKPALERGTCGLHCEGSSYKWGFDTRSTGVVPSNLNARIHISCNYFMIIWGVCDHISCAWRRPLLSKISLMSPYMAVGTRNWCRHSLC